MLATLQTDFFPQACTIQAAEDGQDAYGQPLSDDGVTGGWEDVDGLEDLPCRLAPATGGKRRTAEAAYLNATHVIQIAGQYPAITTKMRAVVDSQAYAVLLVSHDAEGAMTRLTVQIVE